MRVVAVSDTHGNLPEIPDCDLVIHAGDICPDFIGGGSRSYVYRCERGAFDQARWLDTVYREWLEKLEERKIDVVAIWGNHDFIGEKKDMVPALSWTLLQDSSVIVKEKPTAGAAGLSMLPGLAIYGTPWVPNLPSWAFHANDNSLVLRAEAIPEGLDVLVSHGPPYGTADECPYHVGDVPLRDRLLRMDAPPKAVICGHIHEGFGQYELRPGCTLYNVAYVDERYEPVNGVTVLDL